MSIPTSNVVISFSEEPIKRLFESGGTTKNLLNTIKGSDDLLLFNHESNPNFISFEYQFTLGGGQHVATLQFIDPQNEFENRYLKKDIFENIAGFRPAVRPLLPGGKMTHFVSDTTEDGPLTPPLEIPKVAGSEDPVPLPELSDDEQLAKRNEFMNRYIDSYNKKHIYIAFGSGQNTKTWAGPYKMYVMGATIEGSNDYIKNVSYARRLLTWR